MFFCVSGTRSPTRSGLNIRVTQINTTSQNQYHKHIRMLVVQSIRLSI